MRKGKKDSAKNPKSQLHAAEALKRLGLQSRYTEFVPGRGLEGLPQTIGGITSRKGVPGRKLPQAETL